MHRFRTLLILLLIGNLGLPEWGMRSCCCTNQDESSVQRSCCASKKVTTTSAKPQRACCASRTNAATSETRSTRGVVAEQPIHLCQCNHERAMIPAKIVRSLNSDENSFSAVTLPTFAETDFAVSARGDSSKSATSPSGLALLSQICRWRI